MKKNFTFFKKTNPPQSQRSNVSLLGEDDFQKPKGEEHFNWVEMTERNEAQQRRELYLKGEKTQQQIEELQLRHIQFLGCPLSPNFSDHERVIIMDTLHEMHRYSKIAVTTCRLLDSPYADIPDILRKSIVARLSSMQDCIYGRLGIEHINEIHDLMSDEERCMLIFDTRKYAKCELNNRLKSEYRREFNKLNKDKFILDSKMFGIEPEGWLNFLMRKGYHYDQQCDGDHHYEWYRKKEIPVIRIGDDIFHFGNTLSQRVFMMYSFLSRYCFGLRKTIACLIIKEVINYEEGPFTI